MILRIDNSVSEEATDTYLLKPKYLADKATHLFIASHIWDRLDVVLSEEIPEDTLKYVKLRCVSINPIFEEIPDKHCISLLCELYPDSAGAIRKNAMLGRSVREVLP